MNESNNERREYFRIEDNIYLDVQVISEEEYSKAEVTLDELSESAFSLSAEFATLNNKIHPTLNNIRQLHPDIAQYLEFLNTKIDSLSHQLLQKESIYNEDKLVHANISASGIMYESTSNLPQGERVRLEIVLFPEKIGVVIFGRIVQCQQQNSKNCVSIEFEHLREEDQELMIKHNLNKQMSDIREQNNYD